jgi:hypothetical protein
MTMIIKNNETTEEWMVVGAFSSRDLSKIKQILINAIFLDKDSIFSSHHLKLLPQPLVTFCADFQPFAVPENSQVTVFGIELQ